MHPMHALSARDPMQQHQHQMQLTPSQDQDQQQHTMTVLESLNPAQQQHSMGTSEQQAQVMGMIDPVQAHRQQHPVQQQHLAQQQPHLHQLQPSQQTVEQSMSVDVDCQQQHLAQQQQQQQQQQHSIEQRPQIISGEGIVADSGGPIVQWLLENYEIAEGESLPRSTVYNHYLAHCRQLQMASVNAASFGKLIRSVFVGLKTRRLGTRGHSKYHYFGVRAKQHVQHELLQHHETGGGGSSSAGCSRADQNDNSNHRTEDGSESDSTSLAGGANGECGRLPAGSPMKRPKRTPNQLQQSSQALYNPKADQHHHQHHHHHHHHQQQQQQHTMELANNGLYYATNNGSTTNGYGKTQQQQQQHHHYHDQHHNGNNQSSPTLDSCDLADSRNHLGANWTTLVDEHWPQRELGLLEQQLMKANALEAEQSEWPMYLELFESKYKAYYKRMVELLSELKFHEVKHLWLQFWPSAPQSNSISQQQQQQQPLTVAAHCWPTATATIETGDSTAPSDSQQQQQQHLGEFKQQQVVELTFHTLYQLTSQPLIMERINQIDYNLFAAIESFLFPDMLSPVPSQLRQQIEMFAINIGPWLENPVKDYDPQFVGEKSRSARAFGYALRRYAELNRLSTASRAIWEKRSALTQLSVDLSRIDLGYIEHQVSLMTNHKRSDNLRHINSNNNNNNNQPHRPHEASPVDEKATSTDTANHRASGGDQTGNITTTPTTTTTAARTIDKAAGAANNENTPTGGGGGDDDENAHHHNHQQNHHRLCAMQPGQLIQNFLHLLEDPYPANSWPDWCRNLFESRVYGLSMEEARNFVLDEWKNYISRIEKELTLRSAPSLSSFHLIKLLFGEYIDYLVDAHLAQTQHKTRTHHLAAG